MMIFHVIGIGNKNPEFSAHLLAVIQGHAVFSGGQRHYELVKHLLPAVHQWMTVKSQLDVLFENYQQAGQPIVVFASGDPLFYGMANTLKTKYPLAEIHTYPYFSSIQLLAHGANLNSNHLETVSVHGRPWTALDEALIKQEPLIGVLTDQEKSPSAIAERLLFYGYSNYSVWVGEDLEGEKERVRHLQLEVCNSENFHPLNCVILQKNSHRDIPFGLPDDSFEGLEGRPNMITKLPVRLCSLHALDLGSRTVLWDIGFCTGSLSIEAKLHFPHLAIHAFEKRTECLEIMQHNQRKHGAPGINIYMGDIFETDLSKISQPQAVFVGGHGGRLKILLQQVNQYISLGGVIVMNAVQESSINDFIAFSKMVNWKLAAPLRLKVDAHNEITILKAIKEI